MEHPVVNHYNYHKWANERVLEHLGVLPKEVYSKEVQSVFSSISEVVEHIYRTDAMWLSVMSGDSFDETMKLIKELEEKSKGQDLEGMKELYQEVNKDYRDFFKAKKDLDERISIEHPRFGKLESAISDLVRHVVNHGTYHRGNISAMLRQQGHAGVPTDLVYYLYEGG